VNDFLLSGRQRGSGSSDVLVQANSRQHSFYPLDDRLAVDSAAAYCQDVEPPVHPTRPAQAGPAGLRESPDDAGDPEVIEWGGHRARWPWAGARTPAISMALTALAAGLLLGFIGGHRVATANGRPARPATSAATVFAAGDPLIDTGNQCAVQLGHALQLGVEVVNQSDRAVALRQIEPVLPLGGLKAVASRWGTCGALPELGLGPGPGQATALGAGATGWLTVTFDVMVSCPQPLPVQFEISYMQAGRLVTAEFAGFPDLGQVHYNDCATNPQGLQ
jgi:hypothetical protein